MATDAEIRAAGFYAVPEQRFLRDPFQLPTKEVVEEETESFGIPQTQAFTNSGGDNYTGGYNFGNTGFQQAVDARQRNLNKPTDTSTFMGRTMGTVRDFIEPQSASQIMKDGYQEPRFQPGIIGTMLGKIDNYRNLPRADQAFISSQMGYTGPTIFGENNSGLGKDEFGINTRSAFGNYAEYVDKKGKSDMTDEEFADYVDGLKGMPKRMALTYREKSKLRQDLQKESLAGQMQRDAEAGAAGKSDSQDKSRAGSLGRRPGSGGTVDRVTEGPGQNVSNVDNQAYDSGGREGFGYGLKDGGRAGYFFGGRVNYKAGGRINFRGGGMDMGNEENQKQSAEMGNTTVSNNDGGDNNPFVSTGDNNKIVTTDFINKDPSLTVDYTDPRNYASIYSKIGFNNILDNDDLTAAGNVTGEFGPIGYNTNFTDQGITGTNLTAGNFNANISPDMQVQNISYSKGPFSISSDGQNTRAGLTFSYKNGGLAGLL